MLTTEDLTRALADQERRAAQAEQLATTLAAVGAAPDLDCAFAALARGAVALCDGVQGGVRIYGDAQPGGVGVDRGFWVSPDGELITAYFAAPPLGSVSAALRDGAPARLIYDLLALDDGIPPELAAQRRRRGMRGSLAVPVIARGDRIGSLHVDHLEPGFFGPAELALAEALAVQAGGTIERIRATEALRESDERYRALVDRAHLDPEQAARARMDGAMLVARTVAHEINNALTPVVGFAELLGLRPEIARDPTLAASVRLIGEGAADAVDKVRRLQQIVRLEEIHTSPLGPDKPVLDLVRSTEPR